LRATQVLALRHASSARAWEEEYSGKLEEKGYSRGRSVPTVFYNKEKEMSGAVHGDDFTFLGYEEDLEELVDLLKGWFELKVRGILGPDEKDDKEIVILGRTVRWDRDGVRIIADRKHSEAIKKYCGLDENSKGLGNPGKKPESRELAEDLESGNDSVVVDKKRITEYRGMAATANYLGADRVDLQFSAKELCRSMSAPTESSFGKLKASRKVFSTSPEAELFMKINRP